MSSPHSDLEHPSAPSARRRPRGQALAEFVVMLPVLLLLLLATIDVGRLFFSQIQINNAAREGAAFGATVPTDIAGITTHALLEANVQSQRGETAIVVSATCANAGGTAIACSAATAGAGPGNTITVGVSERFSFLTPFINDFFSNNLEMRATASAAVLGYAASGGGTDPGPCGVPVASFVVTVTTGRTVIVDPTASTPNSGICNISGYTWLWGDGNDSIGTATGDTYTYAADGSYNITLTVSNLAGTGTRVEPVVVPAGSPPPTCEKPIASFTYSKNKKVYTFTDTSTVADPINCPITDWAWDFGDGVLGNAQNPIHTYGSASSHTVTLVVTNAGGASTPYTHTQ